MTTKIIIYKDIRHNNDNMIAFYNITYHVIIHKQFVLIKLIYTDQMICIIRVIQMKLYR